MSRLTLRRWFWLPLLLALWLPVQGAWAPAGGMAGPAGGHAMAMDGVMPCCENDVSAHGAQAGSDACHHAGSCDPAQCDACDHCIHLASPFPPSAPRCRVGLSGDVRPVQGDACVLTRYPPPFEHPPSVS